MAITSGFYYSLPVIFLMASMLLSVDNFFIQIWFYTILGMLLSISLCIGLSLAMRDAGFLFFAFQPPLGIVALATLGFRLVLFTTMIVGCRRITFIDLFNNQLNFAT